MNETVIEKKQWQNKTNSNSNADIKLPEVPDTENSWSTCNQQKKKRKQTDLHENYDGSNSVEN